MLYSRRASLALLTFKESAGSTSYAGCVVFFRAASKAPKFLATLSFDGSRSTARLNNYPTGSFGSSPAATL